MTMTGTICAIGTILILGATCQPAAAATRHHHVRHYTHAHVYSRFGRVDPDNYGVYGGPETGFFAGPSYGRTNGYVYY
jgi:hypothetical protein